MNRVEFTDVLEQQLQRMGRPFDRAGVVIFVANAWPLMANDPDVRGWAELFLDAHAPTIGE
jgi:hypothetical protein